MTVKNLNKHFTKKRQRVEALQELINEYVSKKNDLIIEMVNCAIKRKEVQLEIASPLYFCRYTCTSVFIKRNKNGVGNGVITTNTQLDVLEAYRKYAQRWSLEVVVRE